MAVNVIFAMISPCDYEILRELFRYPEQAIELKFL